MEISPIKLPFNEKTFEVSIVGDTTGITWTGEFTCVCVPTMGQFASMEVFEKRLSNDLTTLSQNTVIFHRAISQLKYRLKQAPEWWVSKNEGQDLLDTNVAYEVLSKCLEAEKAWRDAVKESAKAKAEPTPTVTPTA
jgi:hypothetical protein